jgi:hypothetical protein
VLVVRGRIELPTPRFSGAPYDANWPKYGEMSELTVAEAIVGWTDLDGGGAVAVSFAMPMSGAKPGQW